MKNNKVSQALEKVFPKAKKPSVKRIKMYLTLEEAEIIKDLRWEKSYQKRRDKEKAKPKCELCVKEKRLYPHPATKDKLCGVHWRSVNKER